MNHLGLVLGSIAVGVASAACSDAGVDQCMEDAVLGVTSSAQELADWRAEADSILAIAPADSTLDIIVFVAVTSRADFEAWAEGHQVPISYAFFGFSGYRIAPKVRDLVGLKDAPGITGLDWGVGSISAHADCR
jgi:hypothetical protein